MVRIIYGCCRVIEVVIAALPAAMVVPVFGDVVLRYGFDSGITVSEEMSRLPPSDKKVCLVLGQALMLYITWLIFKGAPAQAKINWDVQAPVTGAPVALFYGACCRDGPVTRNW
jgi:TRAP-type C4-dicarboxylate transport system permease small subunit